MRSKIAVSVVYAEPDQQWLEEFEIERGDTVAETVRQSGLLESVPALNDFTLEELSLGVYAKVVSAQELVQEGDRVEIYRPLKADPKEVRRQLAALGKTMGKRR